jgi:GH15 family glucan-1,4-alpha-glucosidase
MTSLAVVGNGAFGAVIDNRSRIVWCCLEGFGGDPIFNSLLNNDSDEGGFLDVSINNHLKCEQKYIPQSAVLVTTLVSSNGDILQVKDFAPRFYSSSDSVNRPCQIFRTISRVRGDPIATIRVRPSFDYNSAEGYQTRGSHHIRYCGTNGTWRLTTNAPIQLLMDESPFLIHETIYLVFGQDETVATDLSTLCKEYEDRTIRYWKQWCGNLCLPVDYQEMISRQAISLQLLQSDEIGGIMNSMTLGIPLGSDLPPTRDDRTIQLTDMCLSLPVVRELGMHAFTKKFCVFLKSVCMRGEPLQAVYGYRGQSSVTPDELTSMAGYLGVGPAMAGGVCPSLVRDSGMSGLAILALSGAFFDTRMKDLCSPKLFQDLEQLGLISVKAFADMIEGKGVFSLSRMTESWQFFEDEMAFLSLSDPDRARSPTEYSHGSVHTLTSVLCWAAADRLARIAEHSHFVEKSKQWHSHAVAMKETILRRAVDSTRGVLTSFWNKDWVGPGILRLGEIGFLAPTDPLFIKSIEAFETDALRICFSKTPQVARKTPDWANLAPSVTLQTSTLLWYVDCLRSMGRVSEARAMFHALCASSNECGLLSQTIDLKDGRQWGNIPHLPTILGMLRVGSRLSRSWRAI